jgi:hypothetical protein
MLELHLRLGSRPRLIPAQSVAYRGARGDRATSGRGHRQNAKLHRRARRAIRAQRRKADGSSTVPCARSGRPSIAAIAVQILPPRPRNQDLSVSISTFSFPLPVQNGVVGLISAHQASAGRVAGIAPSLSGRRNSVSTNSLEKKRGAQRRRPAGLTSTISDQEVSSTSRSRFQHLSPERNPPDFPRRLRPEQGFPELS